MGGALYDGVAFGDCSLLQGFGRTELKQRDYGDDEE